MADGVVGDEMNIRIEVQNDSFSARPEDVQMETEERTPVSNSNLAMAMSTGNVVTPIIMDKVTVAASMGAEDGECSSLSESVESDMEVDTGMLADAESSPMSRGSKPKFERSLSKFAASSTKERADGGGISDGVVELSVEGRPPPRGPRQYPNPFLSGSEDAKKRAERAKRFHDTDTKYKFETEIVSSTLVEAQQAFSAVISDEELLNLYKSSGLLTEDWGEPSFEKVGPQYRLDAILLRGINNMSTDEIFSYLFDIGLVPQAMEWVNDACCIAVYKNKQEAAASLLKLTKPISVDHEDMEKKKNLDIEDKPIPDEADEGEVIDEDPIDSDQQQKKQNSPAKIKTELKYDEVTIIPYDQVAVPMPLGYVWRYAKPCEKAKGILMRYATLQDRKQERAERFSEYYKKHGNPNNPNYRPNEEGPRRKKPFKRVRYNPSPEVSSSEEEDLKEGQKFNVWTKLSADWHDEEDGGRTSNSHKQQRRGSNSNSPHNVRANTPIPAAAGAGGLSNSSSPVFSRLSHPHTRRGHIDNAGGGGVAGASVFDKLDKTSSRKRGWRAPTDDGGEKQFFTPFHDSDDEWTSRLKGPTMRMHADVEESRQKLQATRKRVAEQQMAKASITNRLGLPNRVTYFKEGDRDHRYYRHDDGENDEENAIAAAQQTMSVKDRLGVRRSRGDTSKLEGAEEYFEEEVEDEYLQSLLQQDDDE